MERKYKRRNYFIKKELQGRYVFSFFSMVIIGCLLFIGIFSLMSADKMTISYNSHNLKLGSTPLILLREMLNSQLIFVLIGGALVVILALFLTHRFAGPVYRFEKTLEMMLKGDYSSKIYPRKHDEIKEISNLLNLYNEKISADISEMIETTTAIRESLARSGIAEEATEVRQEIAKALGLTDKITEKLSNFKLKK